MTMEYLLTAARSEDSREAMKMENRKVLNDTFKRELRKFMEDFKKFHIGGEFLIVETRDGFLFKDKHQRQFHVTIYGKEVNGKPAINIHGTREDTKEKEFEFNIIFNLEYLNSFLIFMGAYLEIYQEVERLMNNCLEEIDLQEIKAEYLKKYIIMQNIDILDLQRIARPKKKNEGEVTEEDFTKLVSLKAIPNPDEIIKDETQILLLLKKEEDSSYIKPVFVVNKKLLKIREECMIQVVKNIIKIALKYGLISIEPLPDELNVESLELPTLEDFISEKNNEGM